VSPTAGGAPISLPDGVNICWAEAAAHHVAASPVHIAILMSPKPSAPQNCQPNIFSEPALYRVVFERNHVKFKPIRAGSGHIQQIPLLLEVMAVDEFPNLKAGRAGTGW
jgi:hypothetical protein